MARSWLSIRVELVSGRGVDFWPRPGRIFAAARTHSFAQLAEAIDRAFGRWDLAHLHMFTLADHRGVSPLQWWDGEAPEGTLDGFSTTLAGLRAGEQFAYVFDMGDGWAHLCSVGERRVDPLEELGEMPSVPLPYWGWGSLPDQYGRRWDGDDEESPVPKRPPRGLGDLPPLLPWWGDGRRG
ncbi:IS1096 element passenger TnpR family protein [Streptomyces sp. NPDC054834]